MKIKILVLKVITLSLNLSVFLIPSNNCPNKPGPAGLSATGGKGGRIPGPLGPPGVPAPITFTYNFNTYNSNTSYLLFLFLTYS